VSNFSDFLLTFHSPIRARTLRDKPPKKKPKQERSKATFEAIIQATAHIIEEEGLERLSTNRVARVAGVSIGSLYQYFPDKDALVAEVGRRFSERFQTALVDLLGRLPGLDLRGALHAWVKTLVELHAESPGVHNAVGTGSTTQASAALARVVGGYLEANAENIRRPDRPLAGRVVLDAAEHIIHNTALRDPRLLHDPDWVREVTDMLERYLLVDEASKA